MLVDASGVVKLADFGMAKHVTSVVGIYNTNNFYLMNYSQYAYFLVVAFQLSGQAAALSLRGSPYWMAPEVYLFSIITVFLFRIDMQPTVS